MPKKGQPTYQQTGEALKKQDVLIKAGIASTAFSSLLTRRFGLLFGLGTAYLTGARQLPAMQHQQALAAHKAQKGSYPKDSYPGFWGDSDFASDLSSSLSEQASSAKESYAGSAAEQVVEQVKSIFSK